MGKPYESELKALSSSRDVANELENSELVEAVNSAESGPVLLIGTGGSLSAAEFAACLFDKRNCFARASTPLAFLQSKVELSSSSVFIFSAGGNNKDVLAAFDAAEARSARQIVTVSAALRSKLTLRSRKIARARHISFSLPSGRDGYLATNSLFATAILLARAFSPDFKFTGSVEGELNLGRVAFMRHLADRVPRHIIILFSEWGRLAATDLESKLSESSVASAMLADYRHFAHGRHNWLNKQGDQSAIVAFSNADDEKLATKTLSLVPDTIPVCRFHGDLLAPGNAIAQLLTVFGFVGAFGERVGIDPGRPGVPEYGSKLYHLGPTVRTFRKKRLAVIKFDVPAAVERKLNVAKAARDRRNYFVGAATRYLHEISRVTFGALVADIDGTILPQEQRNGPVPSALADKLIDLVAGGIYLIFATGRGDSIQRVLLKTFPKRVWSKVYVGYLNGAFCLPLSLCDKFSTSCFDVQEVGSIFRRLENIPLLKNHASIKNNRCQITVRPKNSTNFEAIIATLNRELDHEGSDCRVVVSTHSVDLLPSAISKSSCIKFAKSLVRPELEVLAIGDSGCPPGNDFELLSHRYSLSVGSVSPSPTSCWNFLPSDVANVRGTVLYLSQIKMQKHSFSIRP